MQPSSPLGVAIVAAATTTLVVGSLIWWFSHRAATRRGSRSLRLFSYGFGAITIGLFLGALGGVFFEFDVEGALLLQGLFVTPGFILLLGSLHDQSGSRE